MPCCKPLIGLNADYRGADNGRPAYTYVSSGYYDSIIAAGGIPVILPPISDDASLACVLERLDGFVLVGGGDLDPRRDGFMLHPSVRPMSPEREDFDRLLVEKLWSLRVPTFGIGAGMQLMNLTLGGNLFLHIPEDLPNALPHKDPQDPSHRHGLAVEPDSLMGRVYGDGEIRVNSRHHMAIDEVADGFSVTAKCPDGIVEAIESYRDDWFAIGTQFHPESDSASALDVRVFEEFIIGAKRGVGAMRMVA